MPTEKRQIIFSLEEVRDALRAADRGNATRVFKGDLRALSLKDGAVLALIRARGGVEASEEAMAVEPAFLKSALVRACIEQNIPLPLRGHKSVLLGRDAVALLITMEDPTFDWQPLENLGSAGLTA